MASAKETSSVLNFSYIARNTSNGIERGELQASGKPAAIEQLERIGLEPISLTVKKKSIWDLEINLFESVSPSAIYNFTRQLSVMLRAGVPLLEALKSMADDDSSPMLQKSIKKVIDDINAGVSLSDALAKHPKVFNDMFVNIVRAGESAGVLDEVLLQLAEFISYDLELKMGIKQAIRYPMIVVGITVLVGVYAVTFILPRFSALFSSTRIELPLPTRILLGIDQFLQDYLLFVIFGLVVLAFAFYRSIQTKPGRLAYHRFLLSSPVFGRIIKSMAISRFCHVLETLDRTGVPILEAINISCKSAGNAHIESKLIHTERDVEHGKQIAESLKEHGSSFFPSHMLTMIQVGENAGSLDEMLQEIAIMVDNETKDRVKKLTATIEPIITVFMGIMILTLALSIFLPIWDMYEALATN